MVLGRGGRGLRNLDHRQQRRQPPISLERPRPVTGAFDISEFPPTLSPTDVNRRVDDIREDIPSVGTDLRLTRSNIRYCSYQEVRLDTARAAVTTDSQRQRYNASVDDFNSRCSRFSYNKSDKAAVDAELPGKRAGLETEGRTLATSWLSKPPQAPRNDAPTVFETSALTVQTATGRTRQFTVSLATTAQQWAWGMRSPVAANAGMLYIYPQEKRLTHTMANVPMPLDVLFIDSSRTIVQIVANRQVNTTTNVQSAKPVIAMLEINAGVAAKLGIAVGDTVTLANKGAAGASAQPR